jgi:hypothetical protein
MDKSVEWLIIGFSMTQKLATDKPLRTIRLQILKQKRLRDLGVN